MTTVDAEKPISLTDLGESVTEATVTRWLKQPGDELVVDEPLLEVSTDKVDTEIVSPVAGTLARIVAEEGAVVAVGELLAVVAEAGGVVDLPRDTRARGGGAVRDDRDDEAERREAVVSAPALPAAPETTSPATSSPQTLDLARTAPASTPIRSSEDRSSTEKLSRIRQTIARRMMHSLHTSAQLTTVVEVDVTAVAAVRRRCKDDFMRQTGEKLSFLPFFVKAAVEALADQRVINSSLNSDATEVTYHQSCHLGVAVDSSKGLMVPVIRHADNLTVGGFARSIADVASRVRNGSIKPEELSGGTFTVTNTGSRGALFDTPIINQPQSAILGIGAVVERVVPSRVDGALQIGVRSMAYLSLSYDHRIVDGADAARYLSAVKGRLERVISPADPWILT
ncbi:hypothetical protein E3G68_005137 [Mycobacteroides abscessus]|uniref:2-oxo acid dehydrogenase subunit E2 n=1 Tax=Mycobacteroides abscessus TaxID=36809 RepID=UPI0018780965|nr:hypothetical protein [Mycobacteroides abscessus]